MKNLIKLFIFCWRFIGILISYIINAALIKLFIQNPYIYINRCSNLEIDETQQKKFTELEKEFVDKYVTYLSEYKTKNGNDIFIAEFPFKDYITQEWFIQLYGYGIVTYYFTDGSFVTNFQFIDEPEKTHYIVCVDSDSREKLSDNEYNYLMGILVYRAINEEVMRKYVKNDLNISNFDENDKKILKEAQLFSIREWNSWDIKMYELTKQVSFVNISNVLANNNARYQEIFTKIKGKDFPFIYKEKLSFIEKFLIDWKRKWSQKLILLYYYMIHNLFRNN